MVLLNKNNVRDVIKRKSKVLSFPDFDIKVVEMTIDQQVEVEKVKSDNRAVFTIIVKGCCVDENGEEVFDDETFKLLPPHVATKIVEECLKLSGVTESDFETKAKNS